MINCYNGSRKLIHKTENLEEYDNELSFGLVAFRVSYDTSKDIQRSQNKKDANSEELWVEYKKKQSLVLKNKP